MRITCKVSGVQSVVGNINLYSSQTQIKMVKVMNASCSKIKKGAVSRVHSRGTRVVSGGTRKVDLKSRITTSRARADRGKFFAEIKAKAPHAHLVEFGTKSHILNPTGKAIMINGVFIRGPVKHPGSKAYPFMQPAYYAERRNYIRNIREAAKLK